MSHLNFFGEGIYDLHITVDEKQLYDVLLFSVVNNVHLAFAVGKTGAHFQQLMTSQHVSGTALQVLKKAEDTVKKMAAVNINVLRVKIEAMANPVAMRQAMIEFMKTDEYKKNVKYAFEFHYKVAISSFEQQQVLEKLCNENSVSFAVNVLTKRDEKFPLISQRVRGLYDLALDQREKFQKLLTKNGITCLSDGTHYEAIIYDTNYDLDMGFVPDPIEVE